MKLLSLLIAVLSTAGILYLGYLNMDTTLIITCPFTKENFEMLFPYFTILIFVVGTLSGLCLASLRFSGQLESLNAYKRKHEKMSVQSDCDDTKIKALETKIQTLEIALENALKNQ